MKIKKLFIIFTLCFIFLPSTVFADKVCVYDKKADGGYQGALHIVGNKIAFDMFRADEESWFTDEKKITKYLYSEKKNGTLLDPSYLDNGCPKYIVEKSDRVVPDTAAEFLGSNYKLVSETTDDEVMGLDELLQYEWGAANSAIVNYTTILNGGCPSDVAVFKLFANAYDLLKIAAPIILVIFGTIDIAKAVIASDDGMIKKAQSHFVKRVAGAVIVLLSMVVVELFVGVIAGSSDVMSCVNEFFN